MKVKLGEVCHGRTGDKGDTVNISLIPWDENDYEWLKSTVTESMVRDLYAPIIKGRVTRYEYPGIRSLQFVLSNALGGGVSRSLNLDIHGKSFASPLLEQVVEKP
jgi:hypothetical protein